MCWLEFWMKIWWLPECVLLIIFLHCCFPLLLVEHIIVIIFRISTRFSFRLIYASLIVYWTNGTCLSFLLLSFVECRNCLEVWFPLCSFLLLLFISHWRWNSSNHSHEFAASNIWRNWMSNFRCDFPLLLKSCFSSTSFYWLICLIYEVQC